MAKIKILNSGSVGNCYILETENQSLILECGLPWKDIFNAVNFDFSKVAGCLITHEHGDHSKASKKVSENCTIFASQGTIESIDISNSNYHVLEAKKTISIGEFKVLPFDVKHPAKQPFNFIISHKEFGKILFVTDTYMLDYEFKGIDHVIFEANYSEEIVGIMSDSFYLNRLIHAHMSFENALFYLGKMKDSLKTIVLCHLSDRNSNEVLFKEETQKRFGIPTYIAKKNITVNLNI
jgi:phosphoribosyl 1,2-cyclic phosphodiesterase